MDPEPKIETVQKQILNVTSNKEALKILQENAMVQQLLAIDPEPAKLVNSDVLQRIFSLEILQKVQHGGLDEETLHGIVEISNQLTYTNCIQEKTTGQDSEQPRLALCSSPELNL